MNYFEYFSEVEERFNARRGTLLLLSTLDWALIETWREAGVPLAAVLRGIDDAFDKYDARRARAKGRLGKVNGLAWCAQAVMQAANALAEASIGGRADETRGRDTSFDAAPVAAYLEANAAALEALRPDAFSSGFAETLALTATRLRELAEEQKNATSALALEDLDRTLTVMEERLKAVLLTSVPENDLLVAREAAERELAPYRGRMSGAQLRQVRDQFVHKRLFDQLRLPRLSLFYMPLGAPETGDKREDR